MRPPEARQRARAGPAAKGDTTMGRTVPDTATDASAPELRAAGPGDLDAAVEFEQQFWVLQRLLGRRGLLRGGVELALLSGRAGGPASRRRPPTSTTDNYC